MSASAPLLAAGGDAFGIVLAIILLALILGGAFYLEKYFAKKRARELDTILTGHGWTAVPDEIDQVMTGMRRFNLGRTGRAHTVLNLFRAPDHSGEATYVFDYKFTVGSGKQTRHHRQSVVLLRPPGAELPSFDLVPENFFKRIGHFFGTQDFDFPEHPRFSKAFQLRGADEAAVRGLFDAGVLDSLEQRQGISIESSGGYLLAYHGDRCRKPNEMPRFIEEMREAAGIFAAQGKGRYA